MADVLEQFFAKQAVAEPPKKQPLETTNRPFCKPLPNHNLAVTFSLSQADWGPPRTTLPKKHFVNTLTVACEEILQSLII